MFVSSTCYLLLLSTISFIASAAPSRRSNVCQSSHTDFSQGLGGIWHEQHGSDQGWQITGDGLVMTLTKPSGVTTEIDPVTGLPLNNELSPTSPTFVSSSEIQYGKVTYVIKAADVSGAVTAATLMSTVGDEIDFELLGGNNGNIETNYFYGPTPIYNVNKQGTSLGSASSSFHAYTINWTPESIQFYIDGNLIRTVPNTNKCDGSNDACNFPTHAAYIKFGLWDASSPSGTAQWARGPINWNTAQSISATIKSITVECN